MKISTYFIKPFKLMQLFTLKQFMNQKFFGVLEELNNPFYMATSSRCRIKDKRTTFPRLPASEAARTNRSLRLPLQTRLGDVSKGPSRQTHPLINNTTFHFQVPRRHSQIYSNRTPYGTLSPINQITPSVVVVRDTTSMFQADFRVLRHYNNAADSMAEVRGRN